MPMKIFESNKVYELESQVNKFIQNEQCVPAYEATLFSSGKMIFYTRQEYTGDILLMSSTQSEGFAVFFSTYII
jgi:hypothetical protein